MSESRLTAKVGLFVAICLVLLVALLLSFSKGLKWYTPTYELHLRAKSVAGLQKRSLVLMSGLAIGNVAGAEVAPDGKGVLIRLRIREGFVIHRDAVFAIEQIGFLGDQYVAIYPQDNDSPILRPGDIVKCREPLSVNEVLRSGQSLMQQFELTILKLQHAIDRLDRTILSEHTLTNLEVSFHNLRPLSERALALAGQLKALLASNAAPIHVAVTNLANFSEKLDRLTADVRQLLADNREAVSESLQELRAVVHRFDTLAVDLQAGKGLAGAVLKDEAMKARVLNTVASLEVLSSNLNRFGLLYKPKPPKTERARVLRAPGDPFE